MPVQLHCSLQEAALTGHQLIAHDLYFIAQDELHLSSVLMVCEQ